MQALKKTATSILGRQNSLKQPEDAIQPLVASDGKDFFGCSGQEAFCRRLLVHQEAVAGVAEEYAMSVLRILADLQAAHEKLCVGLQHASDLVHDGWKEKVYNLAQGLGSHAEFGRHSLKEAQQQVAQARKQHKKAVDLASESERAAKTRGYYEQKVARLRAAVESARAAMCPTAFSPVVGKRSGSDQQSGSSKGIIIKTMNQRKTDNFDKKQGQLVRNQEKLDQCQEWAQSTRAASVRSLIGCVTESREQLFLAFDEILRACIDKLLPGIHTTCQHAETLARTPVPSADSRLSLLSSAWVPAALPDGSVNCELNMFAIGELVTVTGLNGSPQYNGMAGTVRSLRQDGRVEVELAVEDDATKTANKILAVKLENLCRKNIHLTSDDRSSMFMESGANLLALSAWSAECAAEDPCSSSDEG